MAVEFEDVHDIKPLMVNRAPEKFGPFQRLLIRHRFADTGGRANALLFFVALIFFAIAVIIFIVGLTFGT